jgi:hypothetical protein
MNPNAPCMKNGKCSKGFPKSWCDATIDNEDGYPTYRRRDHGARILTKFGYVDNRWVVPYNRVLTLKYNGHINVEFCASIRAVKYLRPEIVTPQWCRDRC